MAWADDEVAGPMGYKYAALFPQARTALAAYCKLRGPIPLPTNVCLVAAKAAACRDFRPVNDATGLADLPVYLYGYRTSAEGPLALDPLLTGFRRPPICESSIVSFGPDKMLGRAGDGGAFLTNNLELAEAMQELGCWHNETLTRLIRLLIGSLESRILQNRESIALWDRYLGDSLLRIPAEQVMPWRVMRQTRYQGHRNKIISTLRDAGHSVGRNYPSLREGNEWGDTVLNFFLTDDYDKAEIQKACEIIKRVVNG